MSDESPLWVGEADLPGADLTARLEAHDAVTSVEVENDHVFVGLAEEAWPPDVLALVANSGRSVTPVGDGFRFSIERREMWLTTDDHLAEMGETREHIESLLTDSDAAELLETIRVLVASDAFADSYEGVIEELEGLRDALSILGNAHAMPIEFTE